MIIYTLSRLEDDELSNPEGMPPASRVVRREMSQLYPRLGVLNNIPFAIPFEVRVEIFRQFVFNDMRKFDASIATSSDMNSFFRSRTQAIIRRDNIAADGFDKLGSADLRGSVRIAFIDQFGQEE